MSAPAVSGRAFTAAEVEWTVLAAYRAHRLGGRRSALVAAALTETDAYRQVLLTVRGTDATERALWERRYRYAQELTKRVHIRRASGRLYWARASR